MFPAKAGGTTPTMSAADKRTPHPDKRTPHPDKRTPHPNGFIRIPRTTGPTPRFTKHSHTTASGRESSLQLSLLGGKSVGCGCGATIFALSITQEPTWAPSGFLRARKRELEHAPPPSPMAPSGFLRDRTRELEPPQPPSRSPP